MWIANCAVWIFYSGLACQEAEFWVCYKEIYQQGRDLCRTQAVYVKNSGLLKSVLMSVLFFLNHKCLVANLVKLKDHEISSLGGRPVQIDRPVEIKI